MAVVILRQAKAVQAGEFLEYLVRLYQRCFDAEPLGRGALEPVWDVST